VDNKLTEMVKHYYDRRGLKYPEAMEALGFLTTEQAEVWELLLQRKGGWVRNNPQNKPTWDTTHYAEELGDVILMAIVAGIAEGVDPVEALIEKMERKLAALNNSPL